MDSNKFFNYWFEDEFIYDSTHPKAIAKQAWDAACQYKDGVGVEIDGITATPEYIRRLRGQNDYMDIKIQELEARLAELEEAHDIAYEKAVGKPGGTRPSV